MGAVLALMRWKAEVKHKELEQAIQRDCIYKAK